MIAILQPRCYVQDTREFEFNMEDENQRSNFESWIAGLNDNGYHNYIVCFVTPEEYKNNLEKACIQQAFVVLCTCT